MGSAGESPVNSAVEGPWPKAHGASLGIPRDLDGPAREPESLGRRRHEDEPRAVRHREVPRPGGPRLDATDEALGYGPEERHPLLAREGLAGRLPRELPAIDPLPDETRSPRAVAAPRGHLPSHRPRFKVGDFGDSLGVVGRDTKLPQHSPTTLQGRKHLGAKPYRRQAPCVHGVEPYRAPMAHLRGEPERQRF